MQQSATRPQRFRTADERDAFGRAARDRGGVSKRPVKVEAHRRDRREASAEILDALAGMDDLDI